jgi:hypothetical protein
MSLYNYKGHGRSPFIWRIYALKMDFTVRASQSPAQGRFGWSPF